MIHIEKGRCRKTGLMREITVKVEEISGGYKFIKFDCEDDDCPYRKHSKMDENICPIARKAYEKYRVSC